MAKADPRIRPKRKGLSQRSREEEPVKPERALRGLSCSALAGCTPTALHMAASRLSAAGFISVQGISWSWGLNLLSCKDT